MKKLCLFFALALVIFAVCGCGRADDAPEGSAAKTPAYVQGVLLREGTVTKIEVSSLPEGYAYTYTTPDDIGKITKYFDELPLITDFPEDPQGFDGMTWVVMFTYSDGTSQTVYHFGNMFVRTDGGPWYKMNYDDAAAFDALLSELNEK